MPKVSVIIPVYNVEKYLRECLDSVINQTLKDIEIICVNDGSTDGSLEILREYEQKDSRIIVIDKENGGLSSARNEGIKYMTGELCYFLDSDDYILPNLFQYAVEIFKDNDIDYLCFGSDAFVDDDEIHQDINSLRKYLEIKYSGLKKCSYYVGNSVNIHVWNKIFKSEKIKQHDIKFIEGLYYEDIYFVWYYIFLSKHVYFTPQKFHKYRLRKNSIMDDTYKIKSFDLAVSHMKNWYALYQTITKNKQFFIKNYNYLNELLRKYVKYTKNITDKNEWHKISQLRKEYLSELKHSYSVYFSKKEKFLYNLGKIFSIDKDEVTERYYINLFGIKIKIKKNEGRFKKDIENNNLRVLFVTSEYIDPVTYEVFHGGLANYLHKITLELKKCSFDVTVVILSRHNKRMVYHGINLIFVSSRLLILQKIRKLFMSKNKGIAYKRDIPRKRISKIIQKENKRKNIDVIQYASYLATGKYPEKDIPSCVRISSYAKLWQKYYEYKDDFEIEDETVQFRRAQFLYGPSCHMAEYIKNDLGLKNEIKIIETPYSREELIEDNSLYEELLDMIKNNKYLLFFGSVGLLKGCKEIGDCSYSLLKEHPNLDIVLVGNQVGEINDKKPIDYVKEQAKDFSDRIIWFDKTTHSKLYPLIKNAYAILLPSRIDNFPNTCIESMNLKKIVIGARGASFEQLIDDGKNGFLFDSGDYIDLEKTINEVLNLTDEQIRDVSEKAYLRTLELEPDKIIKQLIEYYKFVIKNWRTK